MSHNCHHIIFNDEQNNLSISNAKTGDGYSENSSALNTVLYRLGWNAQTGPTNFATFNLKKSSEKEGLVR